MARSTNPLSALDSLETELRAPQWGLVFTSLIANACLWMVYYVISRWLGDTLQFKLAMAFPTDKVLLCTAGFAVASVTGLFIRHSSGLKVQRLFYAKFFSELNQKRWALIRSKPITAWQDISFRHLPALENYLLDYRPQLKLIATVPLFVLAIVFPISWLAGTTLLITLPLMPIFMWLVGSGTASVQKKHMTALNRLGQFFADRIRGASTVRLLNQENSQLQKFQKASIEHNERLADVIRLAFLNSSVLDFFATVSMALIAVFIGFSLLGEIPYGFYGKEPTLEAGLFILLLSPAFFAELKKLGKLYHVKAEATASTELWQHTLSWKKDSLRTDSDTSFQALQVQSATISGFDKRTLVKVEELNLTTNDRILLSGKSGSGKSVVLDALAGLRTMTGNIQLNNHTVENVQAIRDQIIYIGQTPVFFEGSVRENLSLNQFNDQQVLEALTTVGMSDWLVSLPAQLDTILNENTPLSGGQKQRLALARLCLFNRPIAFLDEPLAHLSRDEQKELLPLLLLLTEDRCSIWISHIEIAANHFTRQWQLTDQQLEEQTR